jgi:hypothetical protein
MLLLSDYDGIKFVHVTVLWKHGPREDDEECSTMHAVHRRYRTKHATVFVITEAKGPWSCLDNMQNQETNIMRDSDYENMFKVSAFWCVAELNSLSGQKPSHQHSLHLSTAKYSPNQLLSSNGSACCPRKVPNTHHLTHYFIS